MKHKHYEMIVAKAANMELVVFFKGINDSCEWHEIKMFPNWQTNASYFLCLPQHKEACLHWLNGGKVESLHQDYEPMELAECGTIEWGVKSTFMKYSIEIRIKPKKEKRWIAVLPSGRVSGWHDEDREMLEEQYNKDAGWQIIEIEVDATAK